MAKFCTKCGRPLQEGEICNCQQTAEPQQATENQQAAEPQQQGFEQVPPQGGNQQQAEVAAFFQKSLLCVINLIKKPVMAGKTMIAEADVRMAVLFIVLQGIFSGFFAMSAGKKCSDLIGGFGGLFSLMGGFGLGGVSIPYGKIFVLTVLISVIMSCVLAGLLLLGHMIIKCKVTFKQMLSAAAIRSALLIPSIFVAFIIFQLSAGIGLFLFIAVNIWGFSAMIITMSSALIEEKKDTFTITVSGAIVIFAAVMMFVVSKAWAWL